MSWCVQIPESGSVLESRKGQAFVTVLEVTSKHHAEQQQDYVTVLQVDSELRANKNGVASDVEKVTIYRLPGERLGMGLKFDGGVQVSETIHQLFIQSITAESPASRAKCRCGVLQEGDKILEIEGKDITTMTRLDCVSALREAPVALNILVQHGGPSGNNVLPMDSKKEGSSRSQGMENGFKPTVNASLMNGHADRPAKEVASPSQLRLASNPPTTTMAKSAESTEINHINNGHVGSGTVDGYSSSSPMLTPPPVPARKLRSIRLSPQMERALQLAQEKYPNESNGEVAVDSSPGPWRRSNRLLETMEELPVEADVYMDLIAEEDQMLNEYESDETGSSISTVIDRCSVSSSNYSESSSNTVAFDLAQALSPFEQLERELESDFPSITSMDNLLPPQLVKSQSSSGNTNNQTLDPPENFQDQPIFTHVNDQNNNVCNTAKAKDLPDNNRDLPNGFVMNERRKFENLVCKMAPSPPKNLPSRRRRKQPPPPPPPQSAANKTTHNDEVNIKMQTNGPSSVSKGIKSILKKKSPAPPVPPRQNKVVRRLFSNSDATSLSSATSSDQVTAQDSASDIERKNKASEAAENHSPEEESTFDLLSSRLGVSQSESPDCSRRLQAVQSWLEASVLLPPPASAEHSPQLERTHASAPDNSRHSNDITHETSPTVHGPAPPIPRSAAASIGPPTVMQEDLLLPDLLQEESKDEQQQGGEAGLQEVRATTTDVTDCVTGSSARPAAPAKQPLPSPASWNAASVPSACRTVSPEPAPPPAACHGVAVNVAAGEEPKMAEHETLQAPLIDLLDFSPSLSRLPPDGHEFPPNFKDPLAVNFLADLSLLDLNDNSPPFKNNMVPQENGYLDPPSGFEDSGIGSTRESSLVDIVNSAVGNDFIVDDDDDMDKVQTACEVNGSEQYQETYHGCFSPLVKLSDETSISNKEVLPLPPLVPSVISAEPSLPLVPSVACPVLPRCGNLQYSATSPVPDETDSIDTLDSAVDCELHEPDLLLESVSVCSRTSSANSQHFSELGQSGDEDNRVQKPDMYSNNINGSSKYRFSSGEESKRDMKQPRLYERTVLRNVDEKNTMSLKEKIALFSQTEMDPVPSPTRKTRENRTESTNLPIKLPDKQRSHSESRRESLSERFQSNKAVDVGKKNGDLTASSKSGVMYRSLGNISSLNNNYNEEYHNTERLPQKNGFHHSTDELPSPDTHDDASKIIEDKVETFASSYGTLPRRSNPTVASASKRYSVGALSYNHTETDGTINGRQRSSNTTSLYSLLESRRQQVSKLRGLIIPEKPESKQMPLAPKNLPLPIIKSSDSVLNGKNRKLSPDKFSSLPRGFDFSAHSLDSVVDGDAKFASTVVLSSPPWKGNTADLPKYSPAFKRKQLSAMQGNGVENGQGRALVSPTSAEPKSKIWDSYQVHTQLSTTYWSASNSVETKSSEPLPISSFSTRSSLSSIQRNNMSSNKLSPSKRHNNTVDNSIQLPANIEDTFDSEDRDSVISSAGSYLSPSLSPPLSPRDGENSQSPVLSCRSPKLDRCLIEDGMVEEYIVVRVPDISAPTVIGADMKQKQGPKPKQKVVRTDSVEAINRWNVLKQAKHSRGGFDDGGNVIFNDQELFDDSCTNLEIEDQVDAFTQNASPLPKEENKISFPLEDSVLAESLLEERLRNNAPIKEEKIDSKIPAKPVSAERWLQLEKKYGNTNGDSNTDMTTSKLPSTAKVACKEDSEGVESNEPIVDPDLKPRRLSQQKTVLNCSGTNPSEDSAKTFKALAEKWEQRSHDAPAISNPVPSNRRCSLPPSLAPVVNKQDNYRSMVGRNSLGVLDPITPRIATCIEDCQSAKEKAVMPTGAISDKPVTRARPNSVSESATKTVSEVNPIHKRSSSKDLLDIMSSSKAKNPTSVSDIRRSFESQMTNGHVTSHVNGHTTEEPPIRRDYSRNNSISLIPNHARMSSLDSTASDSDFSTPAHYGSVTSLTSNARDQYGSITSLASSTSLISPQELQQLIDEANQSLEESGTPQHEISVVVLHREVAAGSIGITLAGGADYESKEITVHKVINGSLADRDGRILKGDRVLSINGKNMKGVTHKDALNILKAPRPECVLVLSRNTCGAGDELGNYAPKVFITRNSTVKPEVLPTSSGFPSHSKSPSQDMSASGKVITTQIMKDAGGLGFSLEGGKDSPIGDRPLSIKKIFQGGAAEKNGVLKIGDEIVSVNSVDVTNMARIEAWNFMKKQPDGIMTITLRQA